VFALLFLLHRENGDFSILMKDMIVMVLPHCCYGVFSAMA
jgi:hypothetical protein